MTITARAVLKANRLFRELPDGTLDKLAALAIRRTLKRGARIFAQGDPGDALLGLIAGQVRISATTPATCVLAPQPAPSASASFLTRALTATRG